MLPVSGAEQLHASDADRRAAHDLGQRGVVEVGQARPSTAVLWGRNRFHSPRVPGLRLQLLEDGRVAVGVASLRHLLAVDGLGGDDALVHEAQQLVAELGRRGGQSEVHGGQLATPGSSRAQAATKWPTGPGSPPGWWWR